MMHTPRPDVREAPASPVEGTKTRTVGRIKHGVRIGKLRLFRQIVHIPSNLEPGPLGDPKFLRKGNLRPPQSRAFERVPAERTGRERRRIRKPIETEVPVLRADRETIRPDIPAAR